MISAPNNMADDLGQDSESHQAAQPAGENQTPNSQEPASEVTAPDNSTPQPAAGATPVEVVDERGYDEYVASLTSGQAEQKQGEPPAEAAPSAAVIETPVDSSAEQGAATPVEGVEPTADETPAAAADDEDTTVDEGGRKPFRPRLDSLPDPEKEAIALRRRKLSEGEDIPLDECLRRVKLKYEGDKPAASSTPQATAPRTVDQIKADLDAVKAEKREALRALDMEKTIELDERIEALNDERHQVIERDRQQSITQQSQEQRVTQESWDRAIQFYPASADQASAFGKKMDEIAARLEAQENPLAHAPDSPWRIAQMAGNELGIAPIDPAKPKTNGNTPSKPLSSTATRPAPVAQRAVGRPAQPAVTPASGSARTAGRPALDFSQLKSEVDYDKFIEQVK